MRSFIVARAEVDHDIRLDGETGVVDVHVGEPFHVSFAYRCREVSRDRDTWRFRLLSTIGGAVPATTERTVEDRRGRIDTVWSHVAQEHVCERPGEHILSFRAEVEAKRGAWDGGDEQTFQKSIEGTCTVRAR